MREINVSKITQTVSELCIKANYALPDETIAALDRAAGEEISPAGQNALKILHENAVIAKRTKQPICQDTGMAVVFLRVGQDVHITGGNLYDAVNDGVRDGYVKGYLRLSVVKDPLNRENTGDNAPAVIHTQIVPGDKIHITVAPKGFGSENMSALKMFTPAAKREDVIDFVADAVSRAGSNPCPPVIVGVGIGGDFEMCAYLAKKALLRPVGRSNENAFYAQMEADMLSAVNRTGVGPQGFGGVITALSVSIETYPTHIAGLPVAVNMGCHVTRHASAEL